MYLLVLKHDREQLKVLTALKLQLVLESTKSKVLKITTETLDLNMFSLVFMGPKLFFTKSFWWNELEERQQVRQG